MDPNEAYRKMVELAAKILFASDYITAEDGYEIATLINDLDEWLKKGGAKPDAWNK